MPMYINHNMMAMNAARNLGTIFDRLATSTQRLSSGLRINSAADDAAGLAIRELMRSDIAVINQGLRNAADAISMIQTAEGALSVIDEKLTRMKELAEQAATGTYTTVQRQIMDSEYQAMAAEIDRIANATDFNGIKLLDGSIAELHDGSGLKVHFGTGNNSEEDYYFLAIDDSRATYATGLRVGGGAGDQDIWDNATGFIANDSVISETEDGNFGLYYNAEATDTTDIPSNLVALFGLESGATTLQDVVDNINEGTAARIQSDIALNHARIQLDLSSGEIEGAVSAGDAFIITVGNNSYGFYNDSGTTIATTSPNGGYWDVSGSTETAAAFIASAINSVASANVTAVAIDADSVIFYANSADSTGETLTFNEADSAGTASDLSNFSWFTVGGNQEITSGDGYNFTEFGQTIDLFAGESMILTIGNNSYGFYNTNVASASVNTNATVTFDVSNNTTNAADLLVSAVNNTTSANVFGVAVDEDTVLWFAKTAGSDGNNVQFIEANSAGVISESQIFTWSTVTGGTEIGGPSGNFSEGGLNWVEASTTYDTANSNYNLRLTGEGLGEGFDIGFLNAEDDLEYYSDFFTQHSLFEAADFTEQQNAADGPSWDGAHIRTQSTAQEALDALNDAIVTKDKTRANLGSMQNRLENTITNLTIQGEMLQASESRISDVDVATEMTEFTRNNIMAQAATAMLSQANSIAQLALSLLG